MKKILFTFLTLSLFLLLPFANGVKAQNLTEDFEEQTALTTSYLDGSFTNSVSGITWTYGHSRDEGSYPITSKGLMLRRASDSYLEATFPNGVGVFTFQYRKAFTGANTRQLELIVNGTQVATTPEFGGVSGADPTIHDFTHTVNSSGSVTIRIKNVGTTTSNRQTTIDNISWTEYGGSTPTIAVTSPTTGANWTQGTSQNITWTASNTNSNVKIEFSDNASAGSPTWNVLAASVAASAGTWTWNIPASQALSSDCKIRITDIPLTASAQSGTFNIVAPTPTVATIAELRAGTIGNTYKLTGEAIVTYTQNFRKQKYIQDATAAILIDDNSGVITTTYQIGDGMTGLTGVLNEYGNMLQFTPTGDPGAPTSTGNVITPEVVTIPQLISNFDNYEAELVKLEDVRFQNPTGNFATGQVYPIVDNNNNTFNFRTTFYDANYIGTAIPANLMDMVVLPNSRNDGDYVTSRDSDDFLFVTQVITVTSPNGGEFVQQGTNFNITWTSANVTGNVKIELTGTNAGVIAASVANNGSYTWAVPANQAIADDYKVKISSVADASIFDESDAVFSVIAPVVLPDLVITEIMYNSPGPDEEWIEIYNNDNIAVDMEGYWLIDNVATHTPIVLPQGAILDPGARYTVKIATNGNFPFVPDFDGSGNFSLNNNQDEIKLYNNYNMLVDSVAYTDSAPWPTAPDGGGSSLTFCDPSLDNSLAENWLASSEPFITLQGDTIYATPGEGCYFSSDNIIISEIMYNPPDNGNDTLEFVEIYNKGNAIVDLTGWKFTSGISYTFPDTTLMPNNYYLVAFNSVSMQYAFGVNCAQWESGMLDNTGDIVTLTDAIGTVKAEVAYTNQAPWPEIPLTGGPSITFCNTSLDNSDPTNWSASTNIIGYNTANQPLYATPGTGCMSGANIVITEIMYNPPETGTDSLEFIELYNLGETAINLKDFKFTQGIQFTFPDITIDTAQYLLVAVDSSAIRNVFNVGSLQWTSGALSNSGENIRLVDNFDVIIDEVHYMPSSPWDTLANGTGRSLTLCDPTSDNSIPSNWTASTEFAGINNIGDTLWATPLGGCLYPLPIANFIADITDIFEGDMVRFTDLSTNSPIEWNWTFEGGTPETSTERNPEVVYNTFGDYSVTLVVANENGSDSLTLTNYIHVDIREGVDYDKSGITVYPNPSNGLVKIENISNSTLKIELISFSGKIVDTSIDNGSVITLNYHNQAKGFYMLRITDTKLNKSETIKLILQ
ncbi:MAG: lamin tail domain-containing protein [Bacteroidales bacterium]|jgi:PKD repeat protein